MQEPVVACENVTFWYAAEPAVQEVTFTVERGEFVALVGPNGGGKTTLLKLALGLLRPQQGRIHLWGEEAHRFRAWHRVGYVPQRASGFDGHFPGSVSEVVAQGEYRGPGFRSFFRGGISLAVQDALKTVGMREHRHRRIGALSAGQQQRVLIARALLRHPELLVLDEPTAGVDTAGEESFYALLRRLNREQGITVFLVTHDIGAVLREATRVACVNRRLVFHGPPSDLSEADLSRLYGVPVGLLLHLHQ